MSRFRVISKLRIMIITKPFYFSKSRRLIAFMQEQFYSSQALNILNVPGSQSGWRFQIFHLHKITLSERQKMGKRGNKKHQGVHGKKILRLTFIELEENKSSWQSRWLCFLIKLDHHQANHLTTHEAVLVRRVQIILVYYDIWIRMYEHALDTEHQRQAVIKC